MKFFTNGFIHYIFAEITVKRVQLQTSATLLRYPTNRRVRHPMKELCLSVSWAGLWIDDTAVMGDYDYD
jgi:hypothetical protein